LRESSIHNAVKGRAWWFILVWFLAGFDALASRTGHAFVAPVDVPVASFTVNKVNAYCGMEAIQERDGNNTPRVSYTLGGCLLARTDTNGSAYYHTDGNGNVTAMVDALGRIKARYLYDPFGNLLAKYGDIADANTRRFSGKEFHARSGLYYYGFRWYDPNLQRWINADPIGLLGGRNKHTFVGNNPVNLVDPYGLQEGLPSKNPVEAFSDWVAATAEDYQESGEHQRIQQEVAVFMRGVGRLGWTLIPASGAIENVLNRSDGISYDFDGNPLSRQQQTLNYFQSSLDAVLIVSPGSIPGRITRTMRVLSTGSQKCGAEAGANILQNAARGNAFERQVIDALGDVKNTTPVNALGGRAIPDLMGGGITEIKDVLNQSFTRQLRIEAAASEGPFSVIFSPRIQRVSRPLQDAVRNSGGTIRVFDPATGTLRTWP